MAKVSQSRRELCIRRVKEIQDAALKAESGPTEKSLFFARYPGLAKIVEEFEHAHLKILQDASSDFDKEDEIRVQFDFMHYAIKAKYYALTDTSPQTSGSRNTNASSTVKLPKISLPSFSGELSLWPSFIALYNTSIHDNQQISPMEKYQYLLASLKGEALSVVKNLPLSEDHYSIAYDTLTGRYQNKRKLATHYWNSLVKAKPLKQDSANSLRLLLDTFNENVRALQLMKFPTESWDFILLNVLLDKLTTSLREKFEAEHRKTEIPRYEQLTKFLHEYCKVFASMSSSADIASKQGEKGTKSQSLGSKHNVSVASFVTNTVACPVCKEQHAITKCPQFLKSAAKDRFSLAKSLRLCLNCLRLGHNMKACPSTWTCRSCQSKHHTLLHFEQNSAPSSTVAPISSASSSQEAEAATASQSSKSLVTMTSMVDSSPVVLLSTAKAEMLDVHGNPVPVRILVDTASQSNFITESCWRRGGFNRTKHRMIVLGVNDVKAATSKGRTSFVIQVANRTDIRLPVEATVLSRISSPLPISRLEKRSWKHLEGLQLADPDYYLPCTIDILLGAEVFVSILRDGCRQGGLGAPDAFNTIFGWVLTGTVFSHPPRNLRSLVTTMDSIDDTVSRFWQLEEIPDPTSGSDDDVRCEELFKRTTRRENTGRFIVSYPFSKDSPYFVDSRQIALNRFRALERRFKSDVDFKTSYSAFMQDYLDSGHMELIKQPYPVDGPVYYLPHHGVIKLDSATTKLRVVFDASSKCTNGSSLNQTLLSGPKLQQDLMAILLRFRVGSVALTADVKQMFRQIWLEPSQRDYQRIVWRFAEDEPISDYRLKTVTFGVTPSPYLAIRCLLQLAKDGRESHPMASATITSSLYVDDIVTSVHSVEEARSLQKQLQLLLQGGGFNLRKWASSHPEVLTDLDPQYCSSSMLSFESDENQFMKILGLRWYSCSDTFGFSVNPLNRDCSKRTILSELARIFDPLGFLTPLTFTAKRLIQLLWTLNLDWDTRPPVEICQRWEKYRSELAALTSLRISRPLARSDVVRRELHGFCDASEQGYGAVVYMRIVALDGVTNRLLSAKSKVAPLKSLTLPRLELCAAVLLSDLIVYIQQVFRNYLTLDDVYAWSDSMIALAWIRSVPHRWKTFVRNRVARIQDSVPISSWGHVSTHSNPADCCSRGLYPKELLACNVWWRGPEWLLNFEPRSESAVESNPESDVASHALVEEEARVSTFVACLEDSDSVIPLVNRFSSLDKISRIIAYCLRFIDNLKGKPVPTSKAVDQLEMHSALLVLVKLVQTNCFTEEITRIKNGKRVSRTLDKLKPFVDPAGILRVGGRIVYSVLPYESKHPALLPNKHRLTELIVERTHQVHLHPGRRALQCLLAQHFWILGAHRVIKRVLSRCYRCFRANPRFAQPPMADLPSERVNQVKPFSITGTDYAGPFFVTNRRARGIKPTKIYVCLFVCFAIKAIHLEVSFSLSTDSFLAALRRFIARRGRCSLLFSDCGTNFIGAHRELVNHMQLASETKKIKWSFNPPSAPHFGGLWESGVRSFKTHLKRVVGDQVLTVEEFGTVLAQIEAVLNSRPLCPMSSDPNDLTVLTPGHFLTMEPLVSLPSPDVTIIPTNRLDRWQLVQRMHQDFWKRWHQEYLHTLQQRPKWLNQLDPIQEGTLVLLREENTSPLQWRRGRITKLHSGRDGVPRVATVKTMNGSLTRPLVKLCPLPTGTSPESN